MSESLSRDELIEKVADELSGCPIWGNDAAFGSDDAWTIADRTMRRVLSAVADDLEVHKDAWIENVDYLIANGGTQVGIDQAAGSAMALGVAAERVRDLLGKDK